MSQEKREGRRVCQHKGEPGRKNRKAFDETGVTSPVISRTSRRRQIEIRLASGSKGRKRWGERRGGKSRKSAVRIPKGKEKSGTASPEQTGLG